MMTDLAFPSSDFPAQPALRVELPEGWHGLPDVGYPLAAGASVGPGEFMPNLLVSINRYPHGHGLDRTKAEIRARCSRLMDLSVGNEEDFTVQGVPAYRVAFAYRDPEAGTLVQSGCSIVVDYGQVEDVVQMTSTCSGEQAERYVPEIRSIEDSLSIDPR